MSAAWLGFLVCLFVSFKALPGLFIILFCPCFILNSLSGLGVHRNKASFPGWTGAVAQGSADMCLGAVVLQWRFLGSV